VWHDPEEKLMRHTPRITFALLVGVSMVTAAAAAKAQMVAQATPQLEPPRADLSNRNNLAPTGATVPHPGEPQIGEESAQERGAQRRSDRDTHSICSNCE
jgi:hypothetical protein